MIGLQDREISNSFIKFFACIPGKILRRMNMLQIGLQIGVRKQYYNCAFVFNDRILPWKLVQFLNSWRRLIFALNLYGGFFDIEGKETRLNEIDKVLADPTSWQDFELSRNLNREKSRLEKSLNPIKSLKVSVSDAIELAELAQVEDDEETFSEISKEIVEYQQCLENLEFTSIFSGKMDSANAFVDIKPGSGGTEAQDWAEMLYKMYQHWAVKKGFDFEIVDHSPGEIAGVKNVTLKIIGDYAFGWVRTENGIHRLVRKSPFDSGQRRHTSFASVFAYPEVDQQTEVNIDPGDLRIDTYRASGAGGQHVNRTDSAVRITHKPTGVVVQCQNDRSQHRNKAEAMAMLRARLYELEQQKYREERQKIEDEKPDISWGNQIRSYVLDQSRIKDLRTGVETGNVSAVLEGELDAFIEASLKAGL